MSRIFVELLGTMVENHEIPLCSQIFPSIARLMRHCYTLVVALYVDNYVEQLMQNTSCDNIISEHEVPDEPFACLKLVSCNCLKFSRARKMICMTTGESLSADSPKLALRRFNSR